jgi:hypothetical protein
MSLHLRSEGTGTVKMVFSVADCLLFKLTCSVDYPNDDIKF